MPFELDKKQDIEKIDAEELAPEDGAVEAVPAQPENIFEQMTGTEISEFAKAIKLNQKLGEKYYQIKERLLDEIEKIGGSRDVGVSRRKVLAKMFEELSGGSPDDNLLAEEMLKIKTDLPEVMAKKEMSPDIEILKERPRSGIGSILTVGEINIARDLISRNKRLAEYYEKGRRTLSGGVKDIAINRGHLINQLDEELANGSIGEFAALQEFKDIIRKVILETEELRKSGIII